jgi:hypothetical protein
MILIHRRKEGGYVHQGLNWHRDKWTALGVLLRVGNIWVGFRIRSKEVKDRKRFYFKYANFNLSQ